MSRVLVAGALHLDVVVDAPRLPHIDETLMGSAVHYVCGGKGGNQAVAAARTGADVAMIGAVAGDTFGRRLLTHLEEARVDTRLIQRLTGGVSGMSVAIIDGAGDYGAVVVSGVNQQIDAAGIAWPSDVSHLLLQNEVSETVNLTLAQLAEQHGAEIVLNAAPMRPMAPELLSLVDTLIVNRIEAEALLGTSLENTDEVMQRVMARSDIPRDLIVTLGGDGLVHHRAGQEAIHIPARPVTVASSHGAGDMFCGALVARLAAGDNTREALAFAMAAAASWVSTPVERRDQIDRAAATRFAKV